MLGVEFHFHEISETMEYALMVQSEVQRNVFTGRKDFRENLIVTSIFYWLEKSTVMCQSA